MRIVVDAMGAPAGSGGMNLYAKELVLAWSATFPKDELIVVGGEWTLDLARALANVHAAPMRGNGIAARSWAQLIWSGITAKRARADALLSLSPIAAVTFPRSRTFAVVHDWRHLTRPDEFGPGQRLYRRLWPPSLRRVRGVIAISEKTHEETIRFAGVANLRIVENGGDHPRRWPRVEPHSSPAVQLLTYGHLANKRPEPVIGALAILRGTGVEAQLTVLGAASTYRDKLMAHAQQLGVTKHVDFPGFVEDAVYQSLVQRASVLVLNSSDEGYGLPVAEATFFGIPVVAASDSGLGGIHGARVFLSEPRPEALATAIRQASSGNVPTTSCRTWAQVSADIREYVVEEINGSLRR